MGSSTIISTGHCLWPFPTSSELPLPAGDGCQNQPVFVLLSVLAQIMSKIRFHTGREGFWEVESDVGVDFLLLCSIEMGVEHRCA